MKIRRGEKERKYWSERQEGSRDDLQSHISGTSLLEYVIVLGSVTQLRWETSMLYVLQIRNRTFVFYLNFIAFEILPELCLSPYAYFSSVEADFALCVCNDRS